MIALLGLSLLLAHATWADPPAIYQRLRLDQTSQFRYLESRSLALLDQPWLGSGYLLAAPDGTLIKLQLSPHRVIMAATARELLYFDSHSGERRRLALPARHPQVAAIGLLQDLLSGRWQRIETQYQAQLQESTGGWRLTLTPTAVTDAPFAKITLEGDDRRRILTLEEADGDRSRTEMELDQRGATLQYTIARLLREAGGG